MNQPPLNASDSDRLRAVKALRLLDTPAEERFDRITRTAKRLFAVPIVLIGLFDESRQWFKSRQGLLTSEMPRTLSLCNHALLDEGVFVVEDTTADPRIAAHPLVKSGMRARFYAGKRILSESGHAVATLCLIDTAPRRFSAEDEQQLSDLAAWAACEINAGSQQAVARPEGDEGARLDAILETIPEGVVITDLRGVIESANGAMHRMFAYEAGSLPGCNIRTLIPHDTQANEQAIRNTASLPNFVETAGIRQHGGEFAIEVAFAPIRLPTRQVYARVVRDISQDKSAQWVKSEFFAMVGHELRTPLTSILGALGMIRHEFGGTLPADVQALLGMAYDNGLRLNDLIRNILDIEKLDAGRRTFTIAPCNVAAALKRLFALNAPNAERLGVSIKLADIPPDLQVMADGDALLQSLSHLLSNACKYSPAGETVEISVELRDEWLRILVVDHGPGVPDEFQSRIFQRFAQANIVRDNRQSGTGLGLNMSKMMVDAMHGRIGYESRFGHGATFYIEVPRANAGNAN